MDSDWERLIQRLGNPPVGPKARPRLICQWLAELEELKHAHHACDRTVVAISLAMATALLWLRDDKPAAQHLVPVNRGVLPPIRKG